MTRFLNDDKQYPHAGIKTEKKLVVFLDFDGVLNSQGTSVNNKRRNEEFRDNKKVEGINWEVECMENVISLFKRLSMTKFDIEVVLNTAWKMCNPERCISKYNDTKLGKLYPCKNVTPTYNYYGQNYHCKVFEIEAYIAQNYKDSDNTLFLCLDDDVPDGLFKYMPVINYRVDGIDGLTNADSSNIFNKLNDICGFTIKGTVIDK